jgi:hypothetical protein
MCLRQCNNNVCYSEDLAAPRPEHPRIRGERQPRWDRPGCAYVAAA